MKKSSPTSMIAYASMLSPINTLQLNKEQEELSLSYKKVYFYDTTLQIGIENIESFTLSDCCSLFYFLTKDRYLHLYEMKSRRVKKNIFKIESSEPIIEIVLWDNALFVLNQTSIKAYSLITWQRLWEKKFSITEGVKSLAIDKEHHLYLLISDNKVFKANYPTESPFIQLTTDTTHPLNKHKKALSLSIKEPYLYVIEAAQITAYNLKTLQKEEELTIDLVQFLDTYALDSQDIEKIIYHNDTLWVLDKGGELSFINQKRVYDNKNTFGYVFNSTHLGSTWHTMQLSFTLPQKGGLIEFQIRAFDNTNNRGDFERFQNSKNIYFESMVGQYLEVQITLFSDPQQSSSPTFHSMKALFPKSTYLEYLPAVYQEDVESKLLLERYLSIFQTISRSIEEQIEQSHLLLNPQTTPSEFLEWLSLWVGLNKQEYWSEEKWRIFLLRSNYFFKKRGTREGLMELMKLYTDTEPIILEPFQLQCEGGEKLFELGAYNFCILFTPEQLKNHEDLSKVQEIVDFWKPAHTQGSVSILSNKMILGNTKSNLIFLGKNSYIGQEEPFILGEAILPLSTRVADREDSIQIQSHSRIGIDTHIKY